MVEIHSFGYPRFCYGDQWPMTGPNRYPLPSLKTPTCFGGRLAPSWHHGAVSIVIASSIWHYTQHNDRIFFFLDKLVYYVAAD